MINKAEKYKGEDKKRRVNFKELLQSLNLIDNKINFT